MQIYRKIFFIFFIFVACSPAGKLKRAQKLINEAIKTGAKTDTLHTYVFDTVKVAPLAHFINEPHKVDPNIIFERCKNLIKLPARKQAAAINDLREELCKPAKIDSTYRLKMIAQGQEYTLPIHVMISNDNTGFRYSIVSGTLRLPIKVEDNAVSIKAGASVWDQIKLGIFVAVVTALVVYLLCKMKII